MPARDYYLPSRQLVNQADASIVATPRVPRSRFLGSWTRKTALDAGILYPIMVEEVLPGDHLTYDVTAYVRMATPLFPIFDNQRIDTHFFFVPSRLLWENWEKMLGSQQNPTDDIDYTVPTITYVEADAAVGGLIDHMGLPVDGQIGAAQDIVVNALPFRAYNLVYNEWFRDENLQDSAEVSNDDGPDDPDDYTLLRRAKFHDYFTSALPWPQKFTAPPMPLGGLAPVRGIGFQNAGGGTADEDWLETGPSTQTFANAQVVGAVTNPAILRVGFEFNALGDQPLIFTDLAATVQGPSLTDFREAMLIQELLERDARGGTRYIELIKNHFGVTSQDARLQRPEYIGGGHTPLLITPIAQTAPTTGAPLGALGAAGSAAGSHHASYAATEHGYIIGLLSVRTELSYQQGISRLWTRSTRFDFYWPTLAGLSEQAILRKEIYATGEAADENIWGYQERWQEYRTRLSEITGIMRSQAAGTLDGWHLAQSFATPPALNSGFIEDDPPMDRVLAAGSLAQGQQYLADIMFRRTAVRPLPTYGIPASLTHF